jgi:hypothetical protein
MINGIQHPFFPERRRFGPNGVGGGVSVAKVRPADAGKIAQPR